MPLERDNDAEREHRINRMWRELTEVQHRVERLFAERTETGGGRRADDHREPEEGGRERAIRSRITAAGLLIPVDIALAAHDNSIAVTFIIDDVRETVEGRGATDDEAADDVVRQLRKRLDRTAS